MYSVVGLASESIGHCFVIFSTHQPWFFVHVSLVEIHICICSVQDGTVRVWDTVLCQNKLVVSGHQQSVTCVKWGGTDLLYTASQDRTVKVWRAEDVSLFWFIINVFY